MVENAFELKYNLYGDIKYANTRGVAKNTFPPSILETIRAHPLDPLRHIEFREGICHRCNSAKPKARWCSDIYGTLFVQYYGWYIRQEFYRHGVHPSTYSLCLEDITPSNLLRRALDLQKAREETDRAYELLNKILSIPNKTKQDKKRFGRLYDECKAKSKKYRRKKRAFEKYFENSARDAFNKKRIGDKWENETKLYEIVNGIMSEHKILRHHRPEWLDGLELDIYLPEFRLGIEYQGEQHFKPIKAWGGKQALEEVKIRDRRKATICKDRGVHLLHFSYNEPIEKEYVGKRIKEAVGERSTRED
jgi:hypothetical protein